MRRNGIGFTRSGFALLTTMLLLVLLIATTAEVATISVTASISASRRANSLRHELAVDSMLAWMNDQFQSSRKGRPYWVDELTTEGKAQVTQEFGSVEVRVRVSYDSAKLNPNRWQHPTQRGLLARKLSVLQHRFHLDGQVVLQPIGGNSPRRFLWFDQLLTDLSPDGLFPIGDDSKTLRWSDVVTFWGDGAVDLRFAAPEVLDAVLEDLQPGLGSLLAAKRSDPNEVGIQESKLLAHLSSDIRSQVAERIAAQSNRFAIQFETAIGADLRRWFVVAVLGGEQPQILHRGQITW